MNRSLPRVRNRLSARSATRRLLVGLLAATGLLAACSSSPSSPASQPSSTSSLKVLPTSGIGCGKVVRSGNYVFGVDQGSLVRTVVIHIPYRYSGTVEVPVVFDLHGTASTAAGEESLSGMDRLGDANGFLVVYPQGSIPAGSGFDWNIPGEPLDGGVPVPATAPDDLAFLYNLIVQLPNDYCVNTRRIFVTGFSDGARMASQLGCQASTVVAAVAPVDGLRFPTPCAAVRKVPVISFHGTEDRVDPYNGNGQAFWSYSVPEAARRWAANNGCAANPTITQPDPGVSLSAYGSCITSSSVELYTITGMGHEWPDGPKVSAKTLAHDGPQSSAIDADEFIWNFFVYHAIPNPSTSP